MKPRFHVAITRQALTALVQPPVLDAIIEANLGQDGLRGQIGHDEYHFDNNAFAAGNAYIDAQRAIVLLALQSSHPSDAWAAFGRLSHAAQDFYAHSNYVTLWLSGQQMAELAASQIDPLAECFLESPLLRSGRLYYPQEILYFIPALRNFALSFLPPDSHAHMNLDAPEKGPRFEFAYQAALKRTIIEFDRILAALPLDLRAAFVGLET